MLWAVWKSIQTKEVKGMLSEEQKRRIDSLYNEYHELALNPETKDMKSFYIGKFLAIEEVLRILGYFVFHGEIRELD